MVVFKKPSKPSAATPPPKAIPTHHTQNTTHAPASYSDIAAGRDSKSESTPIQKLLDTFELCEQVLEYLPMKDVLHITRVCRAFKTNVENSPRLQAKLFLAPDRTLKKLAVSPRNTLLVGHMAEQHIATASAANEAAIATGSEEEFDLGEISLYTPHPYLRTGRLSDRYKRMGVVQYASFCHESCSNQDRYNVLSLDLNTAMSIPTNSSFHDMLLSQPPATKVSVCFPFRFDPGPQQLLERSRWIFNAAGVTMGDVLMMVRRSTDLKGIPPYMKYVDILLSRGFIANAETRDMLENAGELSSQDDPTRWIQKGFQYVLKEGGFEF